MTLPVLVLMATRFAPEGATPTPFRQPQLAAAHGRVAMTFGSGTAIYFTSSSDGREFAPPIKVAEVGVHHYPRLHGKSQFFRLKSLMTTFYQLFRLWWWLLVAPRLGMKRANAHSNS